MTSVTAETFFQTEPRPSYLDTLLPQLTSFVASLPASCSTIALVTSGGTIVPLERNMVRFITNFSRGSRGALSTDAFLAAGCAVIYMHARTAYLPHATPSTCPLLFFAPFESVSDYLFLLRETCLLLYSALPDHVQPMLYLAAAVSDFFIPYAQLPEHKMQSRAEGGTMTITLWTVPKMLKFCKVWCPKAKVVSFKLETDAEVIDSKVALAFSESHVDAVVANLLHEIRTCVTVHIAANDSGNRKQVEILAGADESARTLEDRIVEVLLDALLPAQSTS